MNISQIPTNFFPTYQSLLDLLHTDQQTFIDSLTIDRLPVLLIEPNSFLLLKNQWQVEAYNWSPIPWFPHAIYWPERASMGTSLPGYQIGHIYALNQSSLLPVLAFGTDLAGSCLDACASPGGKTLSLLCNNPKLSLIANDNSIARINKLKKTIQNWRINIPIFTTKSQILYKNFPESFDYILADVPCSSEAHVLKSTKHMSIWNFNRIKTLTSIQFSILSGLLRALKVGGTMVYSTCAVNYYENELLINQFIKRYGSYIKLEPVELPTETEPGVSKNLNLIYDSKLVRRVWPHIHNQDPMFIAKIVKIKSI